MCEKIKISPKLKPQAEKLQSSPLGRESMTAEELINKARNEPKPTKSKCKNIITDNRNNYSVIIVLETCTIIYHLKPLDDDSLQSILNRTIVGEVQIMSSETIDNNHTSVVFRETKNHTQITDETIDCLVNEKKSKHGSSLIDLVIFKTQDRSYWW